MDGPQTEQITELVNCMLPSKKIKKLETAGTLLDKQVKGKLRGLAVQSYNGPTCKVINQVSDILLEIAFPSASVSGEAAKHKAQCKRTWDSLKAFLDIIGKRFCYPEPCTQAQKQGMWNMRAAETDRRGREFVNALKVVHPKCSSLYAHKAAAHCGDMFRRHGYWPVYGGDGIEAKHSVTKMLQQRVSNSKLYQRIKTIMSHYTMRDKAVAQAQVTRKNRELCFMSYHAVFFLARS